MKNSLGTQKFQNEFIVGGKGSLQNSPNNKFSSNAVKKIMTEHLIAPPARVWEKIERILDLQDERRLHSSKILSQVFAEKYRWNDRRKMIVAAAAGATLVAGVLLMNK